jgi:hypothetical protein
VSVLTLLQNYTFPWFVILAILLSVDSLLSTGRFSRLMSMIIASLTLFIGFIRLNVFPPMVETIVSFLIGVSVALAIVVLLEYVVRFYRQN